MDMFKLGQMLGNAYGNLWTANANKRDDKKIEDIKNNLGGLSSKDINDALGGETMTSPITGPDDSVGTLQGGFNETGNAVSAPAQSIARPNSTNGAPIIAGNDLPDPTGLAWRPKYTASDLDKAMKDRGIGKGSRDRALAEYAKETAQQAQEQMLPGVLDRIAGANPHGALQDVLRYSQYDPSMSNILMKDLDRAISFENQQKLKAQELADKMAYASVYGRGGRGGSGGGRGSSGIGVFGNVKAPTEKQALELVKEYQAMFDGASDADRPGVGRMLASARAELEALRNGGPNGWYAYKYGNQGGYDVSDNGGRVVGTERAGGDRGPDVDIDNYDEVKNAIASFPADKRREAVQNYGKAIAKEYGEDFLNNDMYRSMWYEFINDGNEPWLTKEEKNRRVMERANGDWDNINRENANKGMSPIGRFFSSEYWDDLQKKNSGRR